MLWFFFLPTTRFEIFVIIYKIQYLYRNGIKKKFNLIWSG